MDTHQSTPAYGPILRQTFQSGFQVKKSLDVELRYELSQCPTSRW